MLNLEGMISRLGLVASAVSILGSVYIYFIEADEMLGVFVGLWAPTLILFSQEIEKLMESLADPPRFEHGLQAPQAHVISRLHYGSSEFSTSGSCLTPTVSDYWGSVIQ